MDFFRLLLRARTLRGNGGLSSQASAMRTSGGVVSAEVGGTLVVGVEGASSTDGTGGSGLENDVSCSNEVSGSAKEEATGGSIGMD